MTHAAMPAAEQVVPLFCRRASDIIFKQDRLVALVTAGRITAIAESRQSTGEHGPLQMNPSVHVTVFAYGSNMCTERIKARVASATPWTTGYVNQYRLAFHKLGKDGSAKANAVHTGCVRDRIWGVVFSMKRVERRILDDYEFAYERKQVVVVGNSGAVPASMYVARAEAIDGSLKPFTWYCRFVMRGAMQHCLPMDYVHQLQMIERSADPHGDPSATLENAATDCGSAPLEYPSRASLAAATNSAGFAERRRRHSLRRKRGHRLLNRDVGEFTCRTTGADRARCGWPKRS